MYCHPFSAGWVRPIALAALLVGGTDIALAHDLRPVTGDVMPEVAPPMKLYLEDARRMRERFNQRGGAVRGLLYTFKLWPAGNRVEVCFVDGEEALRKVFVETSLQWSAGTSLRLDFGEGTGYRACTLPRPSAIRVSFSQGGHWSYVGIDSRNNNVSGPSLNIAAGGRLGTLARLELQRLTLHEMGHAIGLEHEHQSPESPCGTELDWPKVYDYARLNWGWKKDDVDHNMRTLVSRDRLLTTPYDPKSVMHYQFNEAIFTRGTASPCYVGNNTEMSAGDRSMIQEAYPPAVAAIDQLQPRADSAGKVLASMSLDATELKSFGGELTGLLAAAERPARLTISLAPPTTRGGTRNAAPAAAPIPATDCAPAAGPAATGKAPDVRCRAAADGLSLVIDVTPKP